MKVVVDKEACISCGLCVDLCPDVYQLDDDDKAEAKVDTVPAKFEECAQDGADQCPVDAIEVQ